MLINKFLNNKITLFVALYFGLLVIFIIRLNFGLRGYPQGTNILDTYMEFYFQKTYGIFPWDPLTDWGQPVGGFTGPTLIYPLLYILPISVLIRLFEATLLFASGFLTYYALERTGFSPLSSALSATFYMLMVETSQFFDGHSYLMVTYAFFPIFLFLLYNLIQRPNPKYSIGTAFIFYVIFSLGALDGFYTAFIGTIPFFLFFLIRRVRNEKYKAIEWVELFLAPILFVILSLTWIWPYISGIRPEFTTNITVNIIPFSQTGSISPLYSFSGFIADISYTYFYLHNFTYSFLSGYYYAIFLCLPILFVMYVFRHRSDRLSIFVLIYSFFFAVIATGDIVPVLSGFNYLLYAYIPFFNLNPSLFRWDFLTVIGYTYLLTVLIESFREKLIEHKTKNKKVNRKTLILKIISKLKNKKRLGSLFLVFIIMIIISQNFEIFSSPPTTFQFPQAYTGAYSFLSNESGGYVMEFPFGSSGWRTPWSGVSQSPEFMSPYFSGKDTVMFQAGTPYSLMMDEFIGYGEAGGLSNNISKFLASDNVQYLVITNYHNWSYPSDPVLDPIQSNVGLYHQHNLGSVIYQTANQTVFRLSNVSGALYFTNTYYVYFGGSSILYEIGNLPNYDYKDVLINGSALSDNNLKTILSYSSGLFIPFKSIGSYDTAIKYASAKRVPIYIISNPNQLINGSNTISPYTDLWNSSNGVSYRTLSQGSNLGFNTTLLNHLAQNYSLETVMTRVFLPYYSSVVLNTKKSFNAEGNFGQINDEKPFSQALYQSMYANINNGGRYPYNGSTQVANESGAYHLIWNFTPENNTFQSLSLTPQNFGNDSGFTFTINTTQKLVFVAEFVHGNKFYETSLPEMVNKAGNYSTFYLSYGAFRPLFSLNSFYNSTPVVYFGLAHTSNIGRLDLSNFTAYNISGIHNDAFRNIASSTMINSSIGTPTIELAGSASINFVELALTNSTWAHPPVFDRLTTISSDYSPRGELPSNTSGILAYTQTFNENWNLSDSTSSEYLHIPINIGLNGWFFANTSNGSFVIKYLGYYIVKHAIIVEISALAVFGVVQAILPTEKRRRFFSLILGKKRTK